MPLPGYPGYARHVAGVIYALAEPTDGAVRYVGKASRYARSRLTVHLKQATAGSDLPVHVWLRSLGCEPRLVILERDVSDRDNAERDWIRRLRAEGADLLNVLAGGTGWTKGLPQSLESNRKRAETLRARGPSQEQLSGLARAREAARDPEVRARAARGISAARTGKRYVENPHGTRKRYRQGCTCDRCRAGNAAYQRKRLGAGAGGTQPEVEPLLTEGRAHT